ncbi:MULTISPECIES: hypothetical protein [Phytobacter]|uniref:Uncharacterized protein n=1 Tax=Citrobacter bitternis TaxID=1585982 RepID=A0ABW1Q3B2_9ENTR|nr:MULTISPECIES: hypothetical protein [Phytobacter]MDV2901609.1 hypothetical protein [Phytobacter diazotrophicus]
MSKMTSLLHKSRLDSSSFLRFYGVENQGAENSLRIFFAKPNVIRRVLRRVPSMMMALSLAFVTSLLCGLSHYGNGPGCISGIKLLTACKSALPYLKN